MNNEQENEHPIPKPPFSYLDVPLTLPPNTAAEFPAEMLHAVTPKGAKLTGPTAGVNIGASGGGATIIPHGTLVMGDNKDIPTSEIATKYDLFNIKMAIDEVKESDAFARRSLNVVWKSIDTTYFALWGAYILIVALACIVLFSGCTTQPTQPRTTGGTFRLDSLRYLVPTLNDTKAWDTDGTAPDPKITLVRRLGDQILRTATSDNYAGTLYPNVIVEIGYGDDFDVYLTDTDDVEYDIIGLSEITGKAILNHKQPLAIRMIGTADVVIYLTELP